MVMLMVVVTLQKFPSINAASYEHGPFAPDVQTVNPPLSGEVETFVHKLVQVYVVGANVPLELILSGKQCLVQFITKPPNTEVTDMVGTDVLDVTLTDWDPVQPLIVFVKVAT